MIKTQCDYCGNAIDPVSVHSSEPVTCGARECARWEREELRAIEEGARERAEQDDYERYR